MPISFACPSCAARIKAAEANAGKPCKCPQCGEQLRVPGSTAIAAKRPLPPSPNPAAKSRGILIGAAAGVVSTALIGAALWLTGVFSGAAPAKATAEAPPPPTPTSTPPATAATVTTATPSQGLPPAAPTPKPEPVKKETKKDPDPEFDRHREAMLRYLGHAKTLIALMRKSPSFAEYKRGLDRMGLLLRAVPRSSDPNRKAMLEVAAKMYGSFALDLVTIRNVEELKRLGAEAEAQGVIDRYATVLDERGVTIGEFESIFAAAPATEKRNP